MLKQKVMLMALILIVGMAGYVRADLVAYWPFDEGEGDIAYDIMGGNDGTITGCTWLTPGKIGDAAIEGVGGDMVDCGNGPTPMTDDLTLAWWMIDNHESYGRIMYKAVPNGDLGYSILVRPAGDGGPLRFRIGDEGNYGGWGSECRIPDGAYNDGEWVHITCTYDSATDTATIYVNGVLAPNGDYNPKTGISSYCDGVNVPDVPLYIRGGVETFNGVMDEVAIWDNALTAEQVLRVYESGVKLPGAQDPDPSHGETDVYLDKVLSWGPAPDPNDWSAPDPAVDQYYVYLSNGTSDPNLFLVATVPADAALEYDPTGEFELQRDASYMWRVDSAIEGSGTTDPNTIIGRVWSFAAVPGVPMIDEQPADWFDYPGEAAELRADSTNPYTLDGAGLAYQWYKDGAEIPGETDPTLTIVDTQFGNEGLYKCIVTLTDNGATTETREAEVLTKRMVGHFKMDGNPDDSSLGQNHAALIGTSTEDPTWTDGMDGQCLRISSGGRPYAEVAAENAGDFHLIHRMTASVWIKSAGSPTPLNMDGYACLVGKHISSGDPDHRPWLIRQNGNANRITFRSPEGGWNNYDNTAVFDNEWHLVTGTWDGETGDKKIYIDGELVEVTTGHMGPGVIDNETPLRIGYYKDNFVFVDTLLDDVRVYNYALDGYAVAALWTGFNPGETICVKEEAMDLNNDCMVNLQDFAMFAQEWLLCNRNPQSTCPE